MLFFCSSGGSPILTRETSRTTSRVYPYSSSLHLLRPRMPCRSSSAMFPRDLGELHSYSPRLALVHLDESTSVSRTDGLSPRCLTHNRLFGEQFFRRSSYCCVVGRTELNHVLHAWWRCFHSIVLHRIRHTERTIQIAE